MPYSGIVHNLSECFNLFRPFYLQVTKPTIRVHKRIKAHACHIKPAEIASATAMALTLVVDFQDTPATIVASTVQPGQTASGTAPSPAYSATTVPGTCNSYLPSDTTLNRFMFVVNYYAQSGFYIILDNQFNLDQTAINNQQQWLQRVSSCFSDMYVLEASCLKWEVFLVLRTNSDLPKKFVSQLLLSIERFFLLSLGLVSAENLNAA